MRGSDLFGQGEFQAEGQPPVIRRRTKNPREAACFTFGYNPAVFAQRVRDVCALLAFQKPGPPKREPHRLVALDGTGPIAAVALALRPAPVSSAVIRTGDFRFGRVMDLQSLDFLPAGARYGDLPGALTIARMHVPRLLEMTENKKPPTDPIDWLLVK